MNGNWVDGSPVLDNNGLATTFQYSGNPNNLREWSEMDVMNPPGDRRAVMTVSDGALAYQDHKKFTFAVLYDRSGTTATENVNGLLAVANSAQTFFDTDLEGLCDISVMGVAEVASLEFTMYPNPTRGSFNISWDSKAPIDVVIADMTGRTVFREFNLSGGESLINVDLPSGIYTVNVISDDGILTEKLIVE